MENLQLDWKNNRFVLFSGLLGAVISVSMLFAIIFSGFSGGLLFWLLLGAACAGVAYLVVTKTLTKYTAGFAFLILTLGGSIIHLLIGAPGFQILMNVFLFIAVIGLFGMFYIEKDVTITKITAGAAGLFALCHLLPFGVGGSLPLQDIFNNFKASLIQGLLGLFLFLAAIVVAVVVAMDIIKAQLPMPADQILRICLFTIIGILALQFLVGIFQSQGFKMFMNILFFTLFLWSSGIIAGLSFYIMKEGQEGRVLDIKTGKKPQAAI